MKLVGMSRLLGRACPTLLELYCVSCDHKEMKEDRSTAGPVKAGWRHAEATRLDIHQTGPVPMRDNDFPRPRCRMPPRPRACLPSVGQLGHQDMTDLRGAPPPHRITFDQPTKTIKLASGDSFPLCDADETVGTGFPRQ
jgi:hypothetical protein